MERRIPFHKRQIRFQFTSFTLSSIWFPSWKPTTKLIKWCPTIDANIILVVMVVNGDAEAAAAVETQVWQINAEVKCFDENFTEFGFK